MLSIKEKMNSDRGAIGSVEMILLIALTVFVVLMISKLVIAPLEKSAAGIGVEIQKMDPGYVPTP